MLNHSPWLFDQKNHWPSLNKETLKSEVAIIGGGISGVATLYSLLKKTDKSVVLLEKNQIASGATGHNAGLAIAHIEKSASELAAMLGEEKTGEIFQELDEAYHAFHAIHAEINLENNLLSFPFAANGFCSLEDFFDFIEDHRIRLGSKLHLEWEYLVSDQLKSRIPNHFAHLIKCVPSKKLRETLSTIDKRYIAVAKRITPFKANRTNSALFCHKLLDYLAKNYHDRFAVYEETDIKTIYVHENHCMLEHKKGIIEATETILCTNAYKDFKILDAKHKTSLSFLHDQITPRLGFLAAFPGSVEKSYALGFLNQENAFKDAPFWYFSNAPHPTHNINHSSVLGGPEFDLTENLSPEWIEEKYQQGRSLLIDFLKTTFKDPPSSFPFFWHGWMGYTKDGLRLVQKDAHYPHLWYNVGCNGIGIIPAIKAADKIASTIK